MFLYLPPHQSLYSKDTPLHQALLCSYHTTSNKLSYQQAKVVQHYQIEQPSSLESLSCSGSVSLLLAIKGSYINGCIPLLHGQFHDLLDQIWSHQQNETIHTPYSLQEMCVKCHKKCLNCFGCLHHCYFHPTSMQ